MRASPSTEAVTKVAPSGAKASPSTGLVCASEGGPQSRRTTSAMRTAPASVPTAMRPSGATATDRKDCRGQRRRNSRRRARVPHVEPPVRVRRRQHSPVRAERDALDARSSTQNADSFLHRRPRAGRGGRHRSSPTSGRRAERRRACGALVTPDDLARSGVAPEPHRAVVAGRNDGPTVGRDRDGSDGNASVEPQPRASPLRPDTDGSVRAGRRDVSRLGRDRNGADRAGFGGQDRQPPLRLDRPQACGAVPAPPSGAGVRDR